MNADKAKRLIRLLSLLALILSLVSGSLLIARVIVVLCLLVSVILLYRYLPELSNVSPQSPKTRTLRMVTVTNIALVVGCAVLAVLDEVGILALTDQTAAYLLPVLFAALMIGFGNIAPKLPFNRYTGLRLPWTVSDEETWIVAHRLLGYLAFPCGVLCFAGDPTVLPAAMLLGWIIIPSVLSGVFFWRKYHAQKK